MTTETRRQDTSTEDTGGKYILAHVGNLASINAASGLTSQVDLALNQH